MSLETVPDHELFVDQLYNKYFKIYKPHGSAAGKKVSGFIGNLSCCPFAEFSSKKKHILSNKLCKSQRIIRTSSSTSANLLSFFLGDARRSEISPPALLDEGAHPLVKLSNQASK